MRELTKRVARGAAAVLILPVLVSFKLRSRLLGPDRALEGTTQALALWPGVSGQYLRRAFLAHAIAYCAPTATIEFGTIFSQTGARIEGRAYVGPHCHIGLADIGEDALIAAGVHIPSGARTHEFQSTATPIGNQEHHRELVRIGAGSWIGSAAIVMADVGRGTVVGAGAVVTRPLPAGVIAAGVPARVIGERAAATDALA